VCDVDRRDADALLQSADLLAHLDPELGVEVAERLVEQQDLRLEHHGAGQRHTLLLAAGKLMRLLAAVVDKPDQVEHRLDRAHDRLFVTTLHAQAIGDVLEHRQMGKQGIVLEHEADAAPIGQHTGHVAAADQDGTLVRLLEAGYHA